MTIPPWLTKKRAENPLVIVNNIFVDATTVKGNVTLPNTLTSITPYVFYKNSYLTGVTIPSSIKSIGESTFEYCTSLKSISISSSVTEIGDTAFAFCESLTGTLTIPGNVKKIGFRSFWCCENLNKIVIQYSDINALDASSILGYYAYTAIGGKISMKDFMAK